MFEHFDFRKLWYSLIPIAVVVLIPYLRMWVFPLNDGYSSLLNIFPEDRITYSVIALVTTYFMQAIIMLWECAYHKKYRGMWIALLAFVPSALITTLGVLYSLHEQRLPTGLNSFLITVNILFNPLAMYGLLRRKILYKESLSCWGYVAGLAATYVKLDILWKLLPFGTFWIYTHAIISASVGYFLFFYLTGLRDSGFTFKTMLRPVVHARLLPKKIFYAHFLLLYTPLVLIIFNLLKHDYTLFNFLISGQVQLIAILYMLYFVFARLLLERHQQLRKPVSLSYVLSFVPLVNLFPMLCSYNRIRLKKTDSQEKQPVLMHGELPPHKWILQKWLAIFALVCVILPPFLFRGYSHHLGEYLIFTVPFLLVYLTLLSWRGGIWVFIGFLLVVCIFITVTAPENAPYYLARTLVQALFAYNIHRAIFTDIVEE